MAKLDDKQVRELSLHIYQIFYEIKDNGIFLLAFTYKRRNLNAEDIKRLFYTFTRALTQGAPRP